MNESKEIDILTCHLMGSTNQFSTSFKNFMVSHILAASMNGIFFFPTILLNAVSIITILKSSQLKSKPCYFIILVQSVIDLTVGVFGIPSFLVYLVQGIIGTSNCFGVILAKRLSVVMIALSTITISALTMERYVAILHPYAYSVKVTKKKILVYVASGGVVTFFVITVSFVIWYAIMLFGMLLVTLVFIFTVFAYTRIYLVVRKLNRSQKQQFNPENQENLTRKKLFIGEIKQAKSCFIVVMCFFALSFLPAIAFSLRNSNAKPGEFVANDAWLYTITMFNSSVNSIIFFWTKTMLRKEAKKRLNFLWAKNN